ncbi:MAG: HemK/PrmC family methyltransferase [Bacilli bacterium]
MKVNDIYKKYCDIFSKNDIDEIVLRLILKSYFKYKDMTDLLLSMDDEVKFTPVLKRIIDKVLAGKPVEQVLHEADFYNFSFYINRHVLIPRVETEELVFETLKLIGTKFLNEKEPIVIVDLCCGSGNIGITIDKIYTQPHIIYAIDNSYFALNVAFKNKKKLGSAVKLIAGDFFLPLIKKNIKANVIVCNPPYISKVNEIAKSVISNEPKSALLANPSYLFYERLINNVRKITLDKFIIVCEIGYDLKSIIENILIKSDIINKIKYKFISDINGEDRILIIESIL